MSRVAVIFVTLLGGFIGVAARADDVSLESAPPVVVKTVPEAGAGEVDPNLTEIKVSFSKDMRDGRWSWVMLSQASFPKLDGQPTLCHGASPR